MKSQRPLLCLSILGFLFYLLSPLHASWYSDCMACERHLGGNSRIGPFATLEDCNAGLQLNNSYPYRPCFQEGSDAGSSNGSSDSGLADASSRAIADGLVNGNADSLGLGLMGVAVMGLTSGPSPAQEAAQRQAAQQAELNRRRQLREAQEAEALRQQAFKRQTDEDLADMKGFKGGSGPKAPWDDMSDLKDVPRSPKPKLKKKVPIIHLQARPNPLHKDPLPGDSEHGTEYADWEAAKACAQCTIAKNPATGKIISCPPGFRYFCSGECYSEVALNDLRIPCSSKIMTLEQSSELK